MCPCHKCSMCRTVDSVDSCDRVHDSSTLPAARARGTCTSTTAASDQYHWLCGCVQFPRYPLYMKLSSLFWISQMAPYILRNNMYVRTEITMVSFSGFTAAATCLLTCASRSHSAHPFFAFIANLHLAGINKPPMQNKGNHNASYMYKPFVLGCRLPSKTPAVSLTANTSRWALYPILSPLSQCSGPYLSHHFA